MAEISFPWDNATVGDAIRAPYSAQDEWASLWEPIFGVYDNQREGVIVSNHASHVGNLEVTNPSGRILRVLPGLALVDGTLYSNSANVDFTAAMDGGNYVMLRKNWTTQTVRLIMNTNIGPTQSEGSIWDIVLAIYTTAGGAITASSDERRFLNNIPNMYTTHGHASGAWGEGGLLSTAQYAHGGALQTGVSTLTFNPVEYMAETVITLPEAYYTNNAPIVLATIHSLSAWTDVANNIYSIDTSVVTPSEVTIRVLRSNLVDGAVTVTFVWTALASLYS